MMFKSIKGLKVVLVFFIINFIRNINLFLSVFKQILCFYPLPWKFFHSMIEAHVYKYLLVEEAVYLAAFLDKKYLTEAMRKVRNDPKLKCM